MIPAGASKIREITGAIVAGFRAPSPRRKKWSHSDVALYDAAREQFISAGVRSLEEKLNAERWLQVSVAPRGPGGVARLLSTKLATLAESWLRSGVITEFSWLSKPPRIRLRFSGQDLCRRFQPSLEKWLLQEKKRGAIREVSYGLHDGESWQFGGETGLRLFHRFSTYDSLAIIRFESLRRARTTDPAVFSLLVMNDLMRKTVLDRWELWDVWSNMALTGRLFRFPRDVHNRLAAGFEDDRLLFREIVEDPSSLVRQMPANEQRIVRAYWRRNTLLSAEIRRAEASRALVYGIRKILPFYVVFHWNRLRFGAALQTVLSYSMQRILSPKERVR